jgi:hypothetical protein
VEKIRLGTLEGMFDGKRDGDVYGRGEIEFAKRECVDAGWVFSDEIEFVKRECVDAGWVFSDDASAGDEPGTSECA